MRTEYSKYYCRPAEQKIAALLCSVNWRDAPAVKGGRMQRRPAVFVARVHVGAGAQQRVQREAVAVCGGQMHRRRAANVRRAQVHAVVRERLDNEQYNTMANAL